MSKIALEGNASGTGTFTVAAPNSNSNYTLTLPNSTGTIVVTGGAQTIEFAAGSAAAPSITTTGDTNTGIFFPAADTIAFAEGGAEAMRIDSNGRLGIGTTAPDVPLQVAGTVYVAPNKTTGAVLSLSADATGANGTEFETSYYGGSYGPMKFKTGGSERMRIDSSGNVGIGTTSPKLNANSGTFFSIVGTNANSWLELGTTSTSDGYGGSLTFNNTNVVGTDKRVAQINSARAGANNSADLIFSTANAGSIAERARIDSLGRLMIGRTTNDYTTEGITLKSGAGSGTDTAFVTGAGTVATFSRTVNDGIIISLRQEGVEEGTISVSGNTVSYNGFSGGHWTQLPEGRGYNPEILRGTVMSSIGEMCEWKSVVWDEVIEHPAVPAVEAKEAVVDEEGNVIEPAVEAVEGKDAWTETINKREAYLGNLAVGATFDDDGVTKTVVDDGNERLPKVKISDVVGDKAVYGVFQTWDEVQDMLVTSLGAFVVRIAAGVTVQIGDLLESNGDGCAKVQDDDVIRSKTIGKVTSTVKTATYDDGSYTVPCVLYCG